MQRPSIPTSDLGPQLASVKIEDRRNIMDPVTVMIGMPRDWGNQADPYLRAFPGGCALTRVSRRMHSRAFLS